MKRWLCIILWLCFVGYFSYHLWVIQRTAVNVPFWDEWRLLYPGGISSGWSSDFLFGFHNEHIILPTKIIYLLNNYFFHFNIRFQIIFNEFLFVGLLVSAWYLLARSLNCIIAVIALSPAISTLPWENHTWGFQSQIHFCFLFFLWGNYFIFVKRGHLYFLSGLVLWGLAVFSQAGGLVAVAISTLLYGVSAVVSNPKNIKNAVIIVGSFGVLLIAWLLNPTRGDLDLANYTLPWTGQFYQYIGHTISWGFGFQQLSIVPVVFCNLLLGSVLFFSSRQLEKCEKSSPHLLFLLSLLLGFLSMISLVAFGRGTLGLSFSKSSRYSELAFLLPIIIVAIFQSLEIKRPLFQVAICVLVLLGMWDNLGFADYWRIRRDRLMGKACLREALMAPTINPNFKCPGLYPFSIGENVEIAKQLGASFLNH